MFAVGLGVEEATPPFDFHKGSCRKAWVDAPEFREALCVCSHMNALVWPCGQQTNVSPPRKGCDHWSSGLCRTRSSQKRTVEP
jgi:hypothetical protein